MMDNTVDILRINDIDDLFALENNFESDFNSAFMNFDSPDDLLLDPSLLSEELPPPVNLTASVSDEIPIPTYPKEWLVTDKTTGRQRPPRLYEFLHLLLHNSRYASYASYKDKSQGIFEIYEPEKVADLWEQVKNRQSNQKMTYDKFARAIRWYYQNGIMKKTNARYTFQFSSKTLEGCTIDENNNMIIDCPV